MVANEREDGEEPRFQSHAENPDGNMERCIGSCPSSYLVAFPCEDSKWGSDRMVKIELDAARTLADFAQLALLESENPSGESARKWGSKGRRSSKRVKSESPTRDLGKSLESSKLSSSDLVLDHSVEMQWQHKKFCKNVTIKAVKTEVDSEMPRPTHMCSMNYVSVAGGKSKQNITEAEKEARRLRRVLANRESARKTIRRRQAMCEELTKKATDLASDNERMKQEKELVMKKYCSLKDINEHLKAQMARKIKAEMEESPEEVLLTDIKVPASSSEKSSLIVYNRPSFPPFIWPSIIQRLNHVQTKPFPQSITTQYPISANNMMNPAHELQVKTPFYILPCPWFFPLPDSGNGFLHHPQDSSGSRDEQDDISAGKQHDAGSSSNAMGKVEKHQSFLPRNVSTNTNSTEAINHPLETSIRFLTNVMPSSIRSVKPAITIECRNRLQQNSTSKEESVSSTSSISEIMHGTCSYPPKKLLDAAAAAEARKRRKELTKLKNLHSRQLRLRC